MKTFIEITNSDFNLPDRLIIMVVFIFVVLCIIHCQYYEPHFSQEFLVHNPGGVDELPFYITIDTKGLIEDGYKMDPYCRDFRLYLNETVGVAKQIEFWFEDKCGSSHETKIWSKLNIGSGLDARVIVRYGSDYFIEEDELEYATYLDSNWAIDHDEVNHTRYWDGEFYHLQENLCEEYEEYGQSSYPETNGRILYPRNTWLKGEGDESDFFINNWDDTHYPQQDSAQFHTHNMGNSNSRTPCFEYGEAENLWVNVTLGNEDDYLVSVDHCHSTSLNSGRWTTTSTTVEPEELLPSYRSFQFCRGKFNSRDEGMLALTKGEEPFVNGTSNNSPPNHENIEDGEAYGPKYTIRLHEDDTTQAECTSHGHSGTYQDLDLPHDVNPVFEYSEWFCGGPVFGETYAVWSDEDYHIVSGENHTHVYDVNLHDSTMCGAFGDAGRGVKLYRSQSTDYSDNYNPYIIHMASKRPPFGYEEVDFGVWDSGDTLGNLPIITVSEELDMSVYNSTDSGNSYNFEYGWFHSGCNVGHDHVMEMENIRNIDVEVRAKKGTDSNSVLVMSAEHSHISIIPEFEDCDICPDVPAAYPLHYFHTKSIDIYSATEYLNSSRYTQGYPGFMPFYYVRSEPFFQVTPIGGEEILIEGYTRNGSMPDPDPDPEPPPDADDFLWAYILGGGGGFVLIGVCCFICCNLCLLLCCGCVVGLLIACGCCGGGVGVVGLRTSLNKQVSELKEEKIKEGAQRQMKIAVEKSKFRQEKKKVDEELKKAEEEEKEIAKTVTQLEEEKSKVARTMKDARPASRMKVIDFEEVEQEEKLGKGYLGFKIYRATWPDETVLFRVFPEKTFKTTRFNIFGNFEAELGEYSSLEHPNVLRYIAYSKLPNVGVVTEYCENATLPIYFRKHDMGFEEKVTIVSEIVEGMYYLHQRGVIHRDLQAGNIFLTEELTPKVDFGFNRTFNKKYERSQYAAPELINPQSIPDDDDELPNHEKFDVKCDVFSFGILMFEIAMAEGGSDWNFNPYELEDRKKKIACKVAGDPDYRPDFEIKGAEDVPNWYINLAQMCWSHKAQERPSFERIKNILKNVSSMGDGSESSSSGTETSDSD